MSVIKKNIQLFLLAICSMVVLSACESKYSSEVQDKTVISMTPTAVDEQIIETDKNEADAPRESYSCSYGDIQINEAVTADKELGDWVEIKNISSREIDLSDYYLSDKEKNLCKWRFPEVKIASGELYVVYCETDANFGLSSDGESLFLCDESENIIDYVYLENLPVNGSYGRQEGYAGWFFYETSTPNDENRNGFREMSATPTASIDSGVYDDVEEMTVELSCDDEDTIYYTLDGTAPNRDSNVYDNPITIDKTTVIRACCVGEEKCSSKIKTFSYIVNENHKLPVLSLCVDEYERFMERYNGGQKGVESSASIALYENGIEIFNKACGVDLRGGASLGDAKKTLGVWFRSCYGEGNLKKCDLFGNGIDEYGSLFIRAGQDSQFTSIRDALMGELVLESSDCVPAQHTKYCILYINGNYYGLHQLKENVNDEFFSNLTNSQKSDITTVNASTERVWENSEFGEEFCYGYTHDLSNDDNYKVFCESFDIQSLADWYLLTGYGANWDLKTNVRFYKDDSTDGKWRAYSVDSDRTFDKRYHAFYNLYNLTGNCSDAVYNVYRNLIENNNFRQLLLQRFSQMIATSLSDDNVIGKVERLSETIEPEIERDFERWGKSYDNWTESVDDLRDYIIPTEGKQYSSFCIDRLCEVLDVSSEERELYFSDSE